MKNTFSLEGSVDQLLENLPLGSISRSIGDNMYGINVHNRNAPLPRPRDQHGYTFFTRPQLNLTDDNVSNSRKMFSLLTKNSESYQRYIRLMLDPRLSYMGFSSPHVNPHNVWMPLLTNSLTSLSGWPDLSNPTYTTPSGNHSQQHAWTDGVPNHYESFDLSASFKNTRGNPIIYLMTIWVYYQSLVFEGILNPYIDMITENEIDYMTRIYRITTDSQNRYVSNIAATDGAFPYNVPTGSLFDFNVDKPFNEGLTDINIQFKCIGFMFNEDILKLEFNQSQAIFNSDIAKIIEHDMRTEDMDLLRRSNQDGFYHIPGCNLAKIPHNMLALTENTESYGIYYKLNFNMLPYINIETNELEWWVPKELVGIE